MGSFLDRLNVECRACGHKHIPTRVVGKVLGENGKSRLHLWMCKKCEHIWQDTAFTKD